MRKKSKSYARTSAAARRFGATVSVAIEPSPAGTAGALRYAHDRLQDEFILLNGDSWFDVNLRALAALAPHRPDAAMILALREMPDISRYGSVTLAQGRVTGFFEKAQKVGGGLVNGGVYVCRKAPLFDALAAFDGRSVSLETEIMPTLARDGQLFGEIFEGHFIDIGIPELLPRRAKRNSSAVTQARGLFRP